MLEDSFIPVILNTGMIEFRPDVYGRDRKLYNALFGQPTS